MVFFHSPTDGYLTLEEMLKRIGEYCQNQDYIYKIMIGTDSRVRQDEVEFVTAIVIHRIGKGAKYFTLSRKVKQKFCLQTRMYQEVVFSLEIAQLLVDNNLLDLIGFQDTFEIHIDVGHNGPTKDVLRGVVGMVLGYGFDVKVKPEAFAASSAADKHT